MSPAPAPDMVAAATTHMSLAPIVSWPKPSV